MSADQTSAVEVDSDLIALAMHKLSIDNTNVADILIDCNIYLCKLNRTELLKAASLINLDLIFDCLNTTDQKQIDITCLLIQKFLPVLASTYELNKISVSIERSLRHPSATVKSTILSELEKILAVDNDVEFKVDLPCTIIDCITSTNITVSHNAVKCLKQFPRVETLSSPPIISKLQSLLAMDSKIRTRVYDLLIHWAESVDALALISSKGLFSNLVKDIKCPDVMVQMVTLQMLIPFSIIEHGFDYMRSIGIISGIYRLLSSSTNELSNPSAVVLNPIILEFFIRVTQLRPQLILTNYPKVFVVLYEVLKERDSSLLGVTLNSITYLASSWECKIELDIPTAGMTFGYEGDEELDIWSVLIIELGRIAIGTKSEIKAGAIQAITKIIQVEYGELPLRNDMITRTHKWYNQIKDNPIKNIVHASCALPFLEMQQAGLEMLLALAEQPWGQEEIKKCPELLDLVLKNYANESLVITDLKKIIIKTLLESDTSKDILGEDLMLLIKNDGFILSNTSVSKPDVLVEDMAI